MSRLVTETGTLSAGALKRYLLSVPAGPTVANVKPIKAAALASQRPRLLTVFMVFTSVF
jgi:hypothetical protein